MKINKIALIGAGALGVLYGNRLTEAFGNERVYLSLIMSVLRVIRKILLPAMQRYATFAMLRTP